VEDHLEPEAAQPDLQQWDLWRDRPALALIALSGLSALTLAGYMALVVHRPLELPLGAGVIWLFNTLGGAWLHRRPAERAGAYLLFGAAAIVHVFAWVAAVGALTAGR
jgi:hypothetical protein